MGSTQTCPACRNHTQSIHHAFRDGEPCPVCGLPAHAAAQVLEFQAAHRDSAVMEQYKEMAARALTAEQQVRVLNERIRLVRAAMDEPIDYEVY